MSRLKKILFSPCRRDTLCREELHEPDPLRRRSPAYAMNRIAKDPAPPSSALHLFSCLNEDSAVYETLYARFPEAVRGGKYKALFDAATPEKVLARQKRRPGHENR